MEIYLIRHGQTDYNKKRIIQGRGINSELNETGHEQAKAFHTHYKHVDFHTVFTSTLTRTQQTVAPFVQSGYETTAHAGLDEIDWGIHEGKAGNPELANDYQRLTTAWKQGNLEERISGGESPLELQARQLDFVENTLLALEGKRILICSHGRAMRSLLCTLTKTPLSQMDEFEHYNTCLYLIGYENGGFSIKLANSTDHLERMST